MATLTQLLDAQARLNQQISVLQGQDVDVAKSENLMQGAVQGQVNAVNEQADQQLKANAMSKGLAQGGAMGLAGNQGATGGQMAQIQAEVDNKYAPQRATIEGQRQTALAAAEGARANIPTALAGIRAQNVNNQVSLATLPTKASSTYSSSKTKSITDPNSTLPDGVFQMGNFLGTQAQRDAQDDKTKIDNFNLNMQRNREANPTAGTVYDGNADLSVPYK